MDGTSTDSHAVNKASALYPSPKIPVGRVPFEGAPPPDSCDFRLRLQNELVRRCRKHPRYSLRAFARFLRVDHSSLSQILRGKRRLSPKLLQQFGERLGLTPAELARYQGVSNETVPVPDPRELTHDAFQVISDWYHYAIFELVTLKEFEPDSKWIARVLGLSVSEVNIAVERLFRLGLLKRDQTGKWLQGSELITTTGSPFSTIAFRRLQAQVLQMALDALELVGMEWRDQSSVTMAIDSRRLPEVKERIKRFRRSLCATLQQDRERDAVYQLGISFYPLTRGLGGEL